MSPEQLLRFADAPAYVLLVALGGAILVGAVRKGWVPYWIFNREILRGDRNDETLAKMSAGIEGLADRFDEVGREQKRRFDDIEREQKRQGQILDDLVWDRRDRHRVRGGDDA